MKWCNKQMMLAAATLGLLLGDFASAGANPVTMTFDELDSSSPGSGQFVANYYDGGCGGAYENGPVTCGGPDWGVVWTGAAVATGPLNVPHAFSSPNALVRRSIDNFAGPPVFMNVADGFDSGFSFRYATLTSGTPFGVTFYSGVNGSGDVIATATLPGIGFSCGPNSGLLSCWTLANGFTLDRTVYSVGFEGPANQFAIDDVSFDRVRVPEPAALGLFVLGMLMVGGLAALRRHERNA